ncbi:ABC transporter permease|uniref:ABC transporter permease n=1 Tax=Pseudomonas sp. SbOxS1 TaxID=2723884 RepID=UPI0015D0FB8E|nr:ABC transporter permease [Pseudomonas sp. SbOxS1]NYU03092.1 ABC transporter permease [Pseudomonas sp. SbOxS1]
MTKNIYPRVISLTSIFIKEQLKEPIAFFWIMISPCAMFYFLAATRQDPNYFSSNYTSISAWFYAYISSSVALFGFAFYMIGRRESGFTRSFIYSQDSKLIFLLSHFLAYSLISMAYCVTFYLATKLPFGDYAPAELLGITLRFYICFVMFCAFGAAFSLLPINFQNSNTLLSIFSFCMLILGVMSALRANPITDSLNLANPLTLASRLMEQGLESNKLITGTIITAFIITLYNTFKHLRINPVWSRY